jgi:hypothetical protein
MKMENFNNPFESLPADNGKQDLEKDDKKEISKKRNPFKSAAALGRAGAAAAAIFVGGIVSGSKAEDQMDSSRRLPPKSIGFSSEFISESSSSGFDTDSLFNAAAESGSGKIIKKKLDVEDLMPDENSQKAGTAFSVKGKNQKEVEKKYKIAQEKHNQEKTTMDFTMNMEDDK